MAAHSKLCSSVSAWSGVFASIAMSSVLSASVIVVAGYLLLLFFVSLKPFSLILSGKNATETNGMLQTAFGASCMNRASVFEWHKKFKNAI